jgi:hypothetical protein
MKNTWDFLCSPRLLPWCSILGKWGVVRDLQQKRVGGLISKGRSSIRASTLNKYLVDFNKEGILYGAGWGWYSFIKQSFKNIYLQLYQYVIFE